MGRSPRDFESRASTSFTTPAPGESRAGMLTLLPHLMKGVEMKVASRRGEAMFREGTRVFAPRDRNPVRLGDGGKPMITSVREGSAMKRCGFSGDRGRFVMLRRLMACFVTLGRAEMGQEKWMAVC